MIAKKLLVSRMTKKYCPEIHKLTAGLVYTISYILHHSLFQKIKHGTFRLAFIKGAKMVPKGL